MHTDKRSEDYRLDDGTLIWELVRHIEFKDTMAFADFDVVEIPPKLRTRPHYHTEIDEVFYVISGTGTVFLADGTKVITPGTCFLVPKGSVHSFQVNELPLRMLGICLPRFLPNDNTFVEDIEHEQ